MDADLLLPISVVLVAALVATVTDLRAFRIHNALTLPLMASGLIYHAILGGPPAVLGSCVAAILSSGLLFLFFLMGGVGGGDVKLMAGVGTWLGMPLAFFVFLAASVGAGVYALVLMLACGRARETWVNLKIIWYRLAAVGRHLGAEDRMEAELKRPDRRQRVIPLAAMIAVGIIMTVLWIWLGCPM
jgi:Flp pilus assembly protein protease CpaA